MFKLFLKPIVKIVILLVILISISLFFSKAFRPDRYDSDNNTKNKVLQFYKLSDKTIDTLLLGSSHVYYGINPGLLYEETSLSSYIRGGECQPIETSYYLLKEAYKNQDIKLVILDVFGISESCEVCKTDSIYRINLENMKTSSIKIEAYNDIFKNESLLYNIFDLSLYHGRWKDIETISETVSLTDFGYTFGSNYGYIVNELNDIESDNVDIDLNKLKYLNKIYEICKENNTELLLIKTPYYLSEDDYGIYKSLNDWCIDKNINFINFNDILNEIDYVFDIDGDIWHSNVKGSYKLTKYLSNYINENYSFSKSESNYKDKYHDMVIKHKQMVYSEEYDLDKLIEFIEEDNQILLMNYNYSTDDKLSSNSKKILMNLGFDFKNHSKENMIIIRKNNKVIEEYYNDDYFSINYIMNNQDYLIESNGYIYKNGEGINYASNYICISIIDELTGELIDTFCLDTINDLYVHRDKMEK